MEALFIPLRRRSDDRYQCSGKIGREDVQCTLPIGIQRPRQDRAQLRIALIRVARIVRLPRSQGGTGFVVTHGCSIARRQSLCQFSVGIHS